MSYNITKSNGTTITLADGVVSPTYSVGLLGRIVPAYGQVAAQNELRTLENFANNVPPRGAIKGQMWFDTRTNSMMVWVGADPVNSADNSSADPNSSNWVSLVGSFSSSLVPGTSGVDMGSSTNRFGTGYFTTVDTQNLVAGTTTLGATTVGGNLMPKTTLSYDIGSSALQWDEVFARRFVSSSEIVFTSAGSQLGFVVLDANTIGPKTSTTSLGNSGNRFGNIFSAVVNASTLSATNVSSSLIPITTNSVDLGSTASYWNRGYVGALTLSTSLSTTSPSVTLGSSSSSFGTGYVDTLYSESIVCRSSLATIGTSSIPYQSMYAQTFYGTAQKTKYADLAEKYEADLTYAAGTVVKLGGTKEITATTADSDTNVFGVISTSAGLMMNADAGDDNSWPYVALAGRIPVRVTGTVAKGDRLVSSSTPGVARAVTQAQLTALGPMASFAVIGRAIAAKTTTGEDLVMVAVGAK